MIENVLTPDQITAIAPDAASLKAGRELGTSRKWETTGGDTEVLWGLAMGSGKNPYQTRIRLSDFASKCSCPSRKFPCKHAIGLMFLAGTPGALVETARPPWVVEWMDAHTTRQKNAETRAEEKAAGPVGEKAAEKRRNQREGRVKEGVELLQRSLLDFTRDGLAGGAVRDSETWENLARRMVDCQANGLAAAMHHIVENTLQDSDVDVELPLEISRLYLLSRTFLAQPPPEEPLASEILVQVQGKAADADSIRVEDEWFVAGKQVQDRDRLTTSSSWLLGKQTGMWGRVLRFAPISQAIVDPWPLGSTVKTALSFQAGLQPGRGIPEGDGERVGKEIPGASEATLDQLLKRFAAAMAANPFLQAVPFLILLRPDSRSELLVDKSGRGLPWGKNDGSWFRIQCICGGKLTLMCGEWNGRHLQVISILDGEEWINADQVSK